ncbi:MAG: hypothetical protein O7J95_20625 [Planctomycetota bacterium]|nr:hypothetical protein [Planctomycetota bacterium]
MNKRYPLVVGLALFVLGGVVQAQDAPRTIVKQEAVKKRVQEVLKTYRWSHNLDDLKKRAAEEKKLIFWMQIVGDLGDRL